MFSNTFDLLYRVLRYGAIGGSVSIIYTVGVMFLVEVVHFSNPTVASVTAFVTVLPLSYLLHAHFTFADATHDSFQPMRFAVITTVNFAISAVGMFLITESLGKSYLWGIAFSWAAIPAVNFLIYFLWVFRLQTSVSDQEQGAGIE